MQEKDESKTCRTCAHYRHHYIIEGAQFRSVPFGHCVGKYLSLKERREMPNVENCSAWECGDERERRIKGTEEALTEISERLFEIESVLKELTE